MIEKKIKKEQHEKQHKEISNIKTMLHFFPRNSKQFTKTEKKKLKEPSRKKFRSNLETKLKNEERWKKNS